jgi:DNA-binding CsgD family transcriptional regulator
MASSDALATAIEACYDAAFEFRRWPEALQKLADSLGATSCAIRTRDEGHPFRGDQRKRTPCTPDSSNHAEFTALWLERIEGAPDPHSDRIKLVPKPAYSFIIEDEITTPEERKTLPYYQEIAGPGHREWWACVRFKVKNRLWGLSMFRDSRGGPFDLSEADHFMRVAPDLTRIISAAEKVWESSVATSVTALERLNCAAALLDCRGYAKRFTKDAEALLEVGLVVRHGRIHAVDQASDVRLHDLIGSVVSSSAWRSPCDQPIVIARNGSPWLLAEAIPMTSFAHDLFNGGDILLYFTDLGIESRDLGAGAAFERLLAHSYQLTKAEARLASHLAVGDGIGAASARLAISRETARTQLRMIFAKTRTHHQAELSSLLSRLRMSFDR